MVDTKRGTRRRKKHDLGSSSERGSKAKGKILDVAIELFAKKGFDGVSLEEISRISGSPRSLALYHFESKDLLWKAAASKVIDEFNSEMRSRLADLNVSEDEYEDRSISAWLSGVLDMPEAVQFLVREGGVPTPRLLWLVERFGVPALHLEEVDRYRQQSAISRMCSWSITLALAALGPLLEAKMNAVTGQYSSGIWPMSKRSRDEIIQILKIISRSSLHSEEYGS